MSARYGGQKPEVWEYARYMWPDQPVVQDAFVEAATSIDAASFAVARLPHEDEDYPLTAEGRCPLAEVQARLDELGTCCTSGGRARCPARTVRSNTCVLGAVVTPRPET